MAVEASFDARPWKLSVVLLGRFDRFDPVQLGDVTTPLPSSVAASATRARSMRSRPRGVSRRYRRYRRLVGRLHKKAPFVKQYGWVALAVFIGVPLPFTGAWTGTGIAWLLGLDWKKSFLAVSLGVLMATIIVSIFALGMFGLLAQISL